MDDEPVQPWQVKGLEAEVSRINLELAQHEQTFVRADLYLEQQRRLIDRIDRLRDDLRRSEDEQAAKRRLVYGAVIAASMSLLVTLVTTLLTLVLA